MTIRRILNLLRAFFLIGALICLGTKVAWDAYYPKIRKLDWGLVKLYVRGSEAALERGKNELRAGKGDAAIATLAELADSLDHLRRGDRLAPQRSKALDLLADQNRKTGNLEEALRWSEELYAFDGRDFINLLRRAELLEALGRGEEALPQFRETFRVGSTNGAAQLAYLSALARRGLVREAAGALLDIRGRGPLALPFRGWEFRWRDTSDFNALRMRRLVPTVNHGTGAYRCVELFEGEGVSVRTVRLDFPPSSTPSMTDLRVTLLTAGGDERVLTLDDQKSAMHLRRDGDALHAYGDADPYVVLQLPEGEQATQGVVECRVEFQLSATLPADVAELLAGGFTADLRRELVAHWGPGAVETLEVALAR